jgi:transcription initiation factor TFIID subunit 6
LTGTLLKTFLEPNKSFGAHYGAVKGLQGLVGAEGVRVLLLPNLAAYDSVLKEGLEDEARKPEAEMVIRALLESLALLGREIVGANGGYAVATNAARIREKIGSVLGDRVVDVNNPRLTKAILESDLSV